MTPIPVKSGPGLGTWQTTGHLVMMHNGHMRVHYMHPTDGERRDWFDGQTGIRLQDRDAHPVQIDLPEMAVNGMRGMQNVKED